MPNIAPVMVSEIPSSRYTVKRKIAELNDTNAVTVDVPQNVKTSVVSKLRQMFERNVDRPNETGKEPPIRSRSIDASPSYGETVPEVVTGAAAPLPPALEELAAFLAANAADVATVEPMKKELERGEPAAAKEEDVFAGAANVEQDEFIPNAKEVATPKETTPILGEAKPPPRPGVVIGPVGSLEYNGASAARAAVEAPSSVVVIRGALAANEFIEVEYDRYVPVVGREERAASIVDEEPTDESMFEVRSI